MKYRSKSFLALIALVLTAALARPIPQESAEDRIYGSKPWLRQDLYREESDSDAVRILARLREEAEVPSFLSVFYREWFNTESLSGGWEGYSGDSSYWRDRSPVVYSVAPGMAKRKWEDVGNDEVVLTAVLRDSFMVTGAYTKLGRNVIRDPRRRW